MLCGGGGQLDLNVIFPLLSLLLFLSYLKSTITRYLGSHLVSNLTNFVKLLAINQKGFIQEEWFIAIWI